MTIQIAVGLTTLSHLPLQVDFQCGELIHSRVGRCNRRGLGISENLEQSR
jgi:hypothetical protein